MKENLIIECWLLVLISKKGNWVRRPNSPAAVMTEEVLVKTGLNNNQSLTTEHSLGRWELTLMSKSEDLPILSADANSADCYNFTEHEVYSLLKR